MLTLLRWESRKSVPGKPSGSVALMKAVRFSVFSRHLTAVVCLSNLPTSTLVSFARTDASSSATMADN